MKTFVGSALLLILLVFNSCGNTEDNKKANDSVAPSIIGTWSLYKETKAGKNFDYSGKPTVLSLTMKENGYFILFDKITDEKISDTGIGEIQERYKGQFELVDNTLKMNHFENENLITKTYSVEELSHTLLTLKNDSTKNIQYFKR